MVKIMKIHATVLASFWVVSIVWLASPSLAIAQLSELHSTVTQLEQQLQARVGISIHDLDTGEHFAYHGDDLFPLSSTFKTLACAALLHREDEQQENLQRWVHYEKEALVSYSPVTENFAGVAGMTLADLCEATLTLSDNTAGNLILEAIDGPQGLTQFLRSIGDDVTRLDRWETQLNESLPGDLRDTTSPNAMTSTLNTLLMGDVLSARSRTQLETWLRRNSVGDALLRAGIPASWAIADKTGAGGFGSRSIAAVMWPPNRKPIITAIYITETDASFDERNEAIASIGRAISESLAEQ
ncbi:MAG: beta-lactamase class A [Pseudohongiellaceae bacterium]|jgi:beta-lactamase class A